MSLDRAAARHVEQIVALYYRRRVPPRIRRHLDVASDVGTKYVEPQGESNYEPIGVATAARLLGCSQRHVRALASDLDGVQIDGAVWVFNKATVTDYVAAKREGQQRDCG